MCGALVMTYAVKDGSKGALRDRLTPHLAYQSSKIGSYMLVGVLLGFIGAAFDLAGIRGWVMFVAGLFMVLLGLNMTGRFPALRYLTLRPPAFLKRALASNRRKAAEETRSGGRSLATPLVFGALTGLMPCGPLQAAQLSAAGTGDPVSGAVAMLGFGLGTAPLMVVFGVGSGYLGTAFKRRMNLVAALVVIVLGLVMFNRGSMLVGSPVTFQGARQALAGAPAAEEASFKVGSDGIAEVDLVIENVQFYPQALSIPSDRPVRIVVERREANACSDQLAIPQLGVLADLAPFATTVVEVPAVAAGSYTLTCGMGMMSGQIVAGRSGAGISGDPALGWVVGVGAVTLVGYVLWRRSGVGRNACPSDTRVAAAQPVLFGLSATELLVILAGILAAVLTGLLVGGAVGS
jgi:sulfite exporter TauE/SafE